MAVVIDDFLWRSFCGSSWWLLRWSCVVVGVVDAVVVVVVDWLPVVGCDDDDDVALDDANDVEEQFDEEGDESCGLLMALPPACVSELN